jgi:hypothetical protein
VEDIPAVPVEQTLATVVMDFQAVAVDNLLLTRVERAIRLLEMAVMV